MPGSEVDDRTVVVGVDGSRESWRAIHAAAWEARIREATLVLAHGYPGDAGNTWHTWSPNRVVTGFVGSESATGLLRATAQRVRAWYPTLLVTTRLGTGSGSKVLIEASRTAELVVVGARGQGGFAGLSIGSVAAQTAAYAACPVLVIRPTSALTPADISAPEPAPAGGRPVVVGVDGDDPAVLTYAFDAARHRRAALVVLHAWWHTPRLGPELLARYDPAVEEKEVERRLDDALRTFAMSHPDVLVIRRVVHSLNPSATLVEASEHANLVVVGSRGRGGFAALMLGSVGRDLIGHASAAVVVVHTRPDGAVSP